MEAPAPTVKTGDRITVTVGDVAFGGEGVARVAGFVLFIPWVLAGETVEVEILEVKKQFGRARLVKILQPSPERVAPRCRYFGDCGGCQYQHLAYPAQLRLKRKQVADIFQRIGALDPLLVDPVAPCPQPYDYRNRIMVRSQWDKYKRGLNIGFIRADNRLVVDVEECLIAEPELNRQLTRLRAQPPPKGGIKVVLRLPPPGWEVPRDSFFQNNFHMLPDLVRVVRGCLHRSQARFLLDLYCGVGFFSVELADAVEAFAGVEYDALAVEAARHNAAARQRGNGDYYQGQTEERLPGLLRRFRPEATAVILDPPRRGCQPVILELLRQTRPAQIIFVSCHPATLARDLNVLTAERVYEVVKVVPLDLFPQTQHVECVVDLRSRNERRPEDPAAGSRVLPG